MSNMNAVKATIDNPLGICEIPSCVSELFNSIGNLERQIEQICERVIPICRLPVPTSVGSGLVEAKRAMQTPIGGDLRQISDRINAAATQLTELNQRIEV